MSTYDSAMFLWHDATGNLMDILAMHVDDFIFCGNYLFQKYVIAELKKYIGTHESGTFKFLQLTDKRWIIIDQNLNVSFISPIDIKKGRSLRKNVELSQKEKTKWKKNDWSLRHNLM